MALFRGLYIRWQASAGVALKCLAKNAPVAQLDRASDYESEGRTFESFRARHIPLNLPWLRTSNASGVTAALLSALHRSV